jgi:hypothetical protein
LFGGADSSTFYNDLWRLSLSSRQWEQIAVPATVARPVARESPGCLQRQGKWWVFGGNSLFGPLTDVWQFDLTGLSWTSVAVNQTTERAWPGGAYFTIDYRPATDTAIAFGGVPANGVDPQNTDFVSEFHFASGEWTRLSPSGTAPDRRYAHVSLLHADVLYITLGYSDIEHADLEGVTALNLTAMQWATVAETGAVPSPRDSNFMIALADRPGVGVMFGGWGETVTNDLYTFRAVSATDALWTVVRPNLKTPPARSLHSFVAIAGAMGLVFGGTDGIAPLNDLWRVTAATGAWEQLTPSGVIVPARMEHSAAVVGSVLYVHGGRSGPLPFADMYAYDSIANVWTAVAYASAVVPEARYGHAMAANGLQIFIVAGKGVVSYLNDVHRFDTVARTWTVIAPHRMRSHWHALSTSAPPRLLSGICPVLRCAVLLCCVQRPVCRPVCWAPRRSVA